MVPFSVDRFFATVALSAVKMILPFAEVRSATCKVSVVPISWRYILPSAFTVSVLSASISGLNTRFVVTFRFAAPMELPLSRTMVCAFTLAFLFSSSSALSSPLTMEPVVLIFTAPFSASTCFSFRMLLLSWINAPFSVDAFSSSSVTPFSFAVPFTFRGCSSAAIWPAVMSNFFVVT